MEAGITGKFGGLSAVILIAVASVATAQNTPQGVLQTIAIDTFEPNRIYTSGNGFVYRSLDFGNTWQRSESGIIAWSIMLGPFDAVALTDDVQVIYAATQDRGVLRTTGSNWSTTSGLSGEVHSVAVRPFGKTVYAGANDGIYISEDEGANWALLSDKLGTGVTQGLVIDPTNPLAMYASKWGQGVYRSIDGGISWVLGNSGLYDTQLLDLKIHPQTTSILYAATPSGVFQSVDAGASWIALASPRRASEIAIDPSNPDQMFVTTEGNGIARSTDGGQTWIPLTDGLGDVTQFVSVAVSPDGSGRVYAGSVNQGIFISNNNGETWSLSGEVPPPVATPPGTTPPSTATPPAGPTTLNANIIDRNSAKVELGARANFDVIVRNTGNHVAQDTLVRLNWVQLEFSDSSRPVTASWSGGSCSTDGYCNVGDIAASGELKISVSGSTASDWVGPFRLSVDGGANNTNTFSASRDVTVVRTILVVEDGGGGTSDIWIMLALVFVLISRFSDALNIKQIRTPVKSPKADSVVGSSASSNRFRERYLYRIDVHQRTL